jgi:hypothetical protein
MMNASIPRYINAESIQAQSLELNDSGFLMLRNVFRPDYLQSIREHLVRPYERFFVNVRSALYDDSQFGEFISMLVGCSVTTCADIDPQTSWLRLYTSNVGLNPYRHFHIDLNRYSGRQFRVVVNLLDDSDCDFEYQSADGSIVSLPTTANSICIIEASRLKHRVNLQSGTRLLLMMDYTTTRKRGVRGWLSLAWDRVWMETVASRIATNVDPSMLTSALADKAKTAPESRRRIGTENVP